MAAHWTTHLKNDIADLKQENIELREKIAELRAHLSLPKFVGADDDGNRKDWVAIADVLAWLRYIED